MLTVFLRNRIIFAFMHFRNEEKKLGLLKFPNKKINEFMEKVWRYFTSG